MMTFSAIDIWSCQSDQMWPSRAERKVTQRRYINFNIISWFPIFICSHSECSRLWPYRRDNKIPTLHKWPMHMDAPGYLERYINSVQDIANILLWTLEKIGEQSWQAHFAYSEVYCCFCLRHVWKWIDWQGGLCPERSFNNLSFISFSQNLVPNLQTGYEISSFTIFEVMTNFNLAVTS